MNRYSFAKKLTAGLHRTKRWERFKKTENGVAEKKISNVTYYIQI